MFGGSVLSKIIIKQSKESIPKLRFVVYVNNFFRLLLKHPGALQWLKIRKFRHSHGLHSIKW